MFNKFWEHFYHPKRLCSGHTLIFSRLPQCGCIFNKLRKSHLLVSAALVFLGSERLTVAHENRARDLRKWPSC